MYTFAIIEDHESTNDTFKTYLEKIWPDCTVMQFYTTESALAAISTTDFDLVVSDIEMGPTGSAKYGGFKIAKALDAATCPLLIVSGSPQPDVNRDVFRALDAWDYLQKPVMEADFVMQVKRGIAFRQAQLANSVTPGKQDHGSTRDSDLIINRGDRKNPVLWKGQSVKLTFTQISLLEMLVDSYDQPVSYDRLFEQIITGKNKETLRMHLSQMRGQFEAIDPGFACIKSVPMIGYRWRA
ncbi:MAG TPA: response regulator [Noviherbaspirillum sp.]